MYSTTTKKSNLFGMGLQPFVFGKLTYLARYTYTRCRHLATFCFVCSI